MIYLTFTLTSYVRKNNINFCKKMKLYRGTKVKRFKGGNNVTIK